MAVGNSSQQVNKAHSSDKEFTLVQTDILCTLKMCISIEWALGPIANWNT